MKKCNRCRLNVRDAGNLCPLCGELLSSETEGSKKGGTHPPMYPTIEFNMDAFHLLQRIFTFIAFLVSLILFVINYATYEAAPVLWSLITVAAIVYGMVTIYYSILHNSNLASKILVQTIGASILCIIVDNVIGYKGWSVNFTIPALMLFSNFAVILLMIVSPMKRQTYFMYQLTITVFSIILFVLCFTTIVVHKQFSIAVGIVCILSLAGSIFFGDKSFQHELIRRFHI